MVTVAKARRFATAVVLAAAAVLLGSTSAQADVIWTMPQAHVQQPSPVLAQGPAVASQADDVIWT